MSTELMEAEVVERKPLPGWLAIIDKLVEQKATPELLSKVFEMQLAWEREQARREFVAAFSAFKADAPPAIERSGAVQYPGKNNQQVAYNHVKLDAACEALVPCLSKHGLAHSWDTVQDDKGRITVTCRIEHAAGHSKTVTLWGMADVSGNKNSLQAVGSTVYYLERYTLLAALGIAQKDMDDDGKGAESIAVISPEDIVTLNELLAETQSDLKRFLQYASEAAKVQIESLDQMPRGVLDKCLAMLRSKRDRKKKEKS